MAEHLLSVDPLTGAREYFSYDESTGGFNIRREVDHAPVLEANADHKKQFRSKQNQNYKGDGFHKVASVPMDIYMALPQAMRNDPKAMKKWLNHPDQAPFRTTPGTI